MKKQFVFFLLFSFLISTTIKAHPWKPDHYVIIDTDCGLDDFRAISLMLASANIRVLAIITSNGVVNAKDGYYKVRSLLKDNYHEGVLVGMNASYSQQARNCEAAMSFLWGNENYPIQTDQIFYTDVLNRVFDKCSEKIIFINMGGLNTINSYFNDYPKKIEKVKETIWTCNYDNLLGSFNYLLDTISYNSLKNKKIEIDYINGTSFGKYNNDLLSEINKHDTQLAKNLYKSLSVLNNPFAKKMYDESAVFYLLNKQIISFDSTLKVVEYSLKQGVNINNHFIDLLSYNSANQSQVLSEFSMDTSDYISDIQLMMESTIKKYGKEEWIACVLTSELHRHLGVYSLIGAKMGMRAREYFGAGVDELRIVSFAGLKPPFSCLNDGLQVSTGATLGHGLISVNENTKLPKAEFYYLGRKITISLKEEYRYQIASEIKDLSIIYGLDSNIYWDLVRNLALQYWGNWNRHEMFDIEVQ